MKRRHPVAEVTRAVGAGAVEAALLGLGVGSALLAMAITQVTDRSYKRHHMVPVPVEVSKPSA